jgi:glycosyltransferase involved in cell wall biosynthesis
VSDSTAISSITFFAHLDDRSMLDRVDFYRADIEALRALGLEVRVATNLWEVDWRSDAYIIWWWSYSLLFALIGLLFRKTTVVVGTFNWDTDAPGAFQRLPWVKRSLIAAGARLATANLVPSRQEADRLRKGLRLGNVDYYPHRVVRLAAPEAVPCRLITRGLADGQGQVARRYLLNLAWSGSGNLVRKCVFETVEAFTAIARSCPDVTLVLAGNEGDGAGELISRVERSPFGDRIILLGCVAEPEKAWLIANCSCYVSPSRYEGFGLAIAEAAAAGRPIVTSAVGAVPEVIGVDGALYCDGSNSSQIAEAVVQILADDDLAERLGKAARSSTSCFDQDSRIEILCRYLQAGHTIPMGSDGQVT